MLFRSLLYLPTLNTSPVSTYPAHIRTNRQPQHQAPQSRPLSQIITLSLTYIIFDFLKNINYYFTYLSHASLLTQKRVADLSAKAFLGEKRYRAHARLLVFAFRKQEDCMAALPFISQNPNRVAAPPPKVFLGKSDTGRMPKYPALTS